MQKKKHIIIAIDGHSSCGKSTLAKAIAEKLHYTYIDTGAMYRAVTYFLIENNIDYNDEEAVKKVLPQIDISFHHGHTFLNGEDVEDKIREMEVSHAVSPVSTLSSVRRKLVEQQRKMGDGDTGIVMDGRDIGTVVFPNADLKIFLTAGTDVRAKRRFEELKQKGMEVTLEEVKENLMRRDYIDSSREDSPLSKAEDAILIDNSDLTKEEQLDFVLNLVNQRTSITSS